MNPETPRTEALWVGLRNRHWSRGDQPICDIMASHEQLERELSAERALADRLANALEDIAFGTIIRRKAGGCGQSLICTPEQLQNYAHRALAAWKEARRG